MEERVLMSASLIKDINPGPASSQIQSPVTLANQVSVGSEVYFAANDGVHGEELWKSDGTAAGTVMVDDINPGPGSSNPSDLTIVGSSIYFTADDGTHGDELWVTQGTAATTTMVADINPGPASSNPANLTIGYGYRGLPMLYFTATGTDGTPQVWYTTGNSVAELSKGLSGISDLTATEYDLFFTANDGVHGTELWYGSSFSAPTLIDINPGPGSSNPTDLTAFNNSVYFSADDGTHGRELWEAFSSQYFGMVDDIDPGPASSDPTGLYAWNNSLYFAANGQLWQTRGVPETTFQVTFGPQFSQVTFTPLAYAATGNTLYIASYDSSTDQTELWQTDGTAAGTFQPDPSLHLDYYTPQLYATESVVYFIGAGLRSPEELYQIAGNGTGATLADPNEPAGGWSPTQILGLGNNTLLFAATDSAHGNELWGVPIPSIAAATYLKTDTTTQGSFEWTYGTEGFVTPDENNLPPSIQFGTENASTYQWAAATNDPRALETDFPMSANPFRDASCYYAINQFSLNLNLTDGLTHQVALYLVDYDYQGRSETVQISDATSGQVLSTQNVNNFTNGKWLVYNLTGDVKITFINDGPVDAVVSGVFVNYPSNPTLTGHASYVTTNTTLGGNWVGTYGSGGYDVMDLAARDIPPSITESVGGSFWQWQYDTSDRRAEPLGPGSSSNVAECTYSTTSFNVNLDFNDGKSHQLALYLVDYDYLGRVETVQLSDTVSGKVLDSRTISNFENGEYLVYNVSGDVTITIANDGPVDAVLSGIFIDPAAPSTATATFVKTDATTQGTYTGVYGHDGYDIFGVLNQGSTYGALSFPSDIQSYMWNSSTTEPRALQEFAGSSDRAAACYYSNNPSFSFNLNLTDGKTHQVALYFLDYDNQNRAETIQISEALTGQVLNTQSVSNFSQGKYLVWDLSGDVNITVTNAGGLNEVMSGIFFG